MLATLSKHVSKVRADDVRHSTSFERPPQSQNLPPYSTEARRPASGDVWLDPAKTSDPLLSMMAPTTAQKVESGRYGGEECSYRQGFSKLPKWQWLPASRFASCGDTIKGSLRQSAEGFSDSPSTCLHQLASESEIRTECNHVERQSCL